MLYIVPREAFYFNFIEWDQVLTERSNQEQGRSLDQSSALVPNKTDALFLIRGMGYVKSCIRERRLYAKLRWRTKNSSRGGSSALEKGSDCSGKVFSLENVLEYLLVLLHLGQ